MRGAHRCWVSLSLENREALWELWVSLALGVFPIKSILTSELATHTALSLIFVDSSNALRPEMTGKETLPGK